MFPHWLHTIAWSVLLLGGVCALLIAIDIVRHPQHMAIMDIVWPVTALFGAALVLWTYVRYGSLATREAFRSAKHNHQEPPSKRLTPFPLIVAKGALHGGAGCSIGDVLAQSLAFAFPVTAT